MCVCGDLRSDKSVFMGVRRLCCAVYRVVSVVYSELMYISVYYYMYM